MTFYIYRKGTGFELANGDGAALQFADEAAAADEAVRIAQDNEQLYTLNYWRP